MHLVLHSDCESLFNVTISVLTIIQNSVLNKNMCNKDNDVISVFPLPADERFEQLRALFAARYYEDPAYFVRVPGRVNLIGEHIDYCGYGVCPMALEQDILLAVVKNNEGILTLSNTESQFTDYECNLKDFSITAGDGAPQWYQYFLCGVKGVIDILPKSVSLKGMKVVVNGTIPQSAGLSSSSALVSAAALATAFAHNFTISKEKLANLCAKSERYIGTQGGGMDQAIAFLATKGCAKLIEFSPLRSQDVELPPGAVFVIAHSLARMNKAATADFNCRVVECRLAAQIIAKKKGLNWEDVKKLGDLQKALGVDLKEMLSVAQKVLHKEPYSKEEILKELATTSGHLELVSLTPNTKHIQSFKLRQRALHVFQEAERVEHFLNECRNSSGDTASLKILGHLMSESHKSLRDLYECSHSQLDQLVELSRDLAFGARLTGAGWGGCTVALLPPENIDKYITTLKEKFYKTPLDQDQADALVFATAPNSGACIYLPA